MAPAAEPTVKEGVRQNVEREPENQKGVGATTYERVSTETA